ncbi:hypothetical protein [Bifidobacterium coryneforme]|uniref:hypothetical protein n=1 Tax=Bifidobacterium coryneforme TaxID=1687 RepID=UPI0023F22BBF|nr:hypothetical protein [Bifidobacterium coryneforme]
MAGMTRGTGKPDVFGISALRFGRQRIARALIALSLTLILATALAACAPSNQAVGDTWHPSTVDHDGVDRSDILVALVGSPSKPSDEGANEEDSRILASLKQQRMDGYYSQAESLADQQAGVEDAVNREVDLILVHAPARGDWAPSLAKARKAGIPVAVIPKSGATWEDGPDGIYYAATLSLDADTGKGTPVLLADALQNIIDDGPHARAIRVTLGQAGE